MWYEARMAMVFISYAKDDNHRVDALEAALVASSASVWRDKSQVPPGADHWRLIEREIEQAKAVIVCCSAASLNNKNVRKELGFAESREIPLLTIALESPRSLRPPIELIGQSMEDLSHWRGDVLDPAFLKLLSAIGEAAGEEKLKRRYPDWIAEQRDQEEAQKRAADAQRATEATERRIAAEAAAKAQADFEKAKVEFEAGQRALWEALPVTKAARRAKEGADRCKQELARASAAFDQVKNVSWIDFELRKQGGCWTAALFWLGLVSFLAFMAEIVSYGGMVFMNLPLALVCFVWVALVRQPRVSFNASALSYDSRANRAKETQGAAANADAAHQSAQAAADDAWKPFQRAIDEFESKRPRE